VKESEMGKIFYEITAKESDKKIETLIEEYLILIS